MSPCLVRFTVGIQKYMNDVNVTIAWTESKGKFCLSFAFLFASFQKGLSAENLPC